MNLHIYLNFNGNTTEVVEFYAHALGLEMPKILKFSDLPTTEDEPFISNEINDLVLHAKLKIGDSAIEFSDIFPGMNLVEGNNFSIAVSFSREYEIINAYNNLIEGAVNVFEPLGETIWAEQYAYLVDKYNIPWMLSYTGNAVMGEHTSH